MVRLYKELGKQTLGGHKQNLLCTRTQEKESVTPQETDPDLPESVKESLKEAWVDSGLLQGRGSAVPAQNLLKEVIIFIQRRQWQSTPVFLPRESLGQRSLVGYCPWGHTESDTTEATQQACMPWRRKWQPTPVFLPRESQGQRSLVGCSLWVTESDRLKLLPLRSSSSSIIFMTSTIVWLRSNNREGTQPHPSTENWIKDLLSMTPPIRTRPSFPLSQSLPSGSFHKPLILLHQSADRLKTTITEN